MNKHITCRRCKRSLRWVLKRSVLTLWDISTAGSKKIGFILSWSCAKSRSSKSRRKPRRRRNGQQRARAKMSFKDIFQKNIFAKSSGISFLVFMNFTVKTSFIWISNQETSWRAKMIIINSEIWEWQDSSRRSLKKSTFLKETVGTWQRSSSAAICNL